MRQMDLRMKRGEALVLVAHPDDETIWMGGTILAHPGIRWTIFALCRKDDPDRAPKFLRVCKEYGATGIMSDLEDDGKLSLRSSVLEIEQRIARNLDGKTFNYFFTHGENGEYGHPRHRGVCRAAMRMLKTKKLLAGRVFLFDYRLDRSAAFAVPDYRARFVNHLSQKIMSEKLDIIEHLYGFSPTSFESLSCFQVESFQRLNLETLKSKQNLKNKSSNV